MALRMTIKQKAYLWLGGSIILFGLAGAYNFTRIVHNVNEETANKIHATDEIVLNDINLIKGQYEDSVRKSMRYLVEKSQAPGEPTLGATMLVGEEKVPSLLFGSAVVNNTTILVDRVASMMGGTATLFVRSGDDFVRVATNVKKSDGSRAIGTKLDPNGKAIASVREGKNFYGVVEILGHPFMTGYEPILDRNNQVIGVWFVGFKLENLSAIEEMLQRSKLLANGFYQLVDGKGQIIAGREAKGLNGDDWDKRFVEVPSFNFRLVSYVKKSDVTEAGLQTLIRSQWTFVVVAFLVLAFGYLLVRQINKLTEDIREVVIQIREASTGVMGSSQELVSVSGELSAATEIQGQAIQQTSVSLNQISSMVGQSRSNSQTSEREAIDGERAASEGKEAVDEMGRQLQAIGQATHKLGKSAEQANAGMGEIGTMVSEISAKTKVINDIVFQLKLLSFNASVEAARAGENGKGFSVVAEEVGNLATLSGRAANEIDQLLSAKNERVNTIVEESSTALRQSLAEGERIIQDGFKVAERCNVAITSLLEKVSGVRGNATQITAAADEQTIGISEINKAVQQLDAKTQESHLSAVKTKGYAEDLAEQASSLQASVARLETSVLSDEERAKRAA